MVISMPGTLTSMLLDTGSRAPRDRTGEDGNVIWSIQSQPLGPSGTHWGRRAPFPGSRQVQSWDRASARPLVPCEKGPSCPLANAEGINYAPFFAEGGESYALNGRQSKPTARAVMWDVFTWLADLPVDKLPLSGQYRKSHLNSEAREELLRDAEWPEQAVDDLLQLLHQYFRSETEGGNPVQDLLMLGFSEYMGALDEELHDKFFGVKPDSAGGLFDRYDPSKSIDPGLHPDAFDMAFEQFLDSLEDRYTTISRTFSGGSLGQLQRWRQSLNLPWKTKAELCSNAISIDAEAFRRLDCAVVVDMENLCQTQPEDVAKFDPHLCGQFYGDGISPSVLVPSIVIPILFLSLLIFYFYVQLKKRRKDDLWIVKPSELHFADPPELIGSGSYGVVFLAEYRGTKVAVKQCCQDDKRTHESHSCSFHSSDGSGISFDIDEEEKFSHKFSFGLVSGRGRKSSEGSNSRQSFLDEMYLLSSLRHPCITTIMGAVVETGETQSLVMEYMELGALYDVLRNKSIAFDGDLILPILQEISQGVRFLHGADPQVIHGDLKTKNILIDAKFRAKVADFGLSHKNQQRGTPLWMAPELLRKECHNSSATDVYAFGVLLYEVYSRRNPYEGENVKEVLRLVADKSVNKRPSVPTSCPEKVGILMNECLDADPASRPTFEEIDLKLQRFSVESVDPGEAHLSYHARKELKASRTNHLLYEVFPPHVAEALRDGRKPEQEIHECVTIFFSDIVGFTSISESSTPRKVCDMLDRLYLRFDEICGQHDIFKIETIGDAYLAVANLHKDQTTDHAKRIAEFAINAVQAASETLIDEEYPEKGHVQIRVGFHTGQVISDVLGSRLPKYSVFGDTVSI